MRYLFSLFFLGLIFSSSLAAENLGQRPLEYKGLIPGVSSEAEIRRVFGSPHTRQKLARGYLDLVFSSEDPSIKEFRALLSPDLKGVLRLDRLLLKFKQPINKETVKSWFKLSSPIITIDKIADHRGQGSQLCFAEYYQQGLVVLLYANPDLPVEVSSLSYHSGRRFAEALENESLKIIKKDYAQSQQLSRLADLLNPPTTLFSMLSDNKSYHYKVKNFYITHKLKTELSKPKASYSCAATLYWVLEDVIGPWLGTGVYKGLSPQILITEGKPISFPKITSLYKRGAEYQSDKIVGEFKVPQGLRPGQYTVELIIEFWPPQAHKPALVHTVSTTLNIK